MKKAFEDQIPEVKKFDLDFLSEENMKNLATEIATNNPVPFIEDFEERVESDWYTRYFQQTKYVAPRKDRNQWERHHAESRLATATFMEDARKHAIYMGVPEQYAAKVVDRAWSDGHSNGYNNVLLCLQDLIGIFK